MISQAAKGAAAPMDVRDTTSAMAPPAEAAVGAALFFLFAAVLLASALLTILSRNPVHSVLWLILAFLNAAGLMLILGAEFLAMTLILVYVGAVAVLFLFVVMMLDIGRAELRAGLARHWFLGLFIAAILLFELLIVLTAGRLVIAEAPPEPASATTSNIEAFGQLLFTRYLLHFEMAGLILLVAIMGAVLMVKPRRDRGRSQRVSDQVRRRPKDSVRLASPPVGQGVDFENPD
jgi:NADH-quinone oxidoreductase subunit J